MININTPYPFDCNAENFTKTSENTEVKVEKVPIYQKLALSIREAAEYSGIGINKIDSMLRTPNCPFVLFVGTKKLVKRKEFENFIAQKVAI